MALNPGQKLGPYEIESAAGAGGMGEVYRAKDTRLDRIVAIKVLPAKTAGNADLRARFEREARAISSLNHPNICTLHDIGHEEGIDYLVMEFLEGETIGDRVKKGPVDIREALEIGIQIADALDKAHRKGLIHRDLKPANVILTKEGAKLLDFGLAKLSVSGGVVDGISGLTQTTPLTGTGTIIGTIQYMAPEQLDGSEADARSDIFAFGAVLYQMVTGKRPFEGKSQASLIAAIIERSPEPISNVVPMAPPGLNRLIKKCLAKDPDDRWQSARDMADELRWISQSGSQAGVAAPIAARRKLRLRLGWSIAAVTTLVAGLYAFLWYTQPPPEEPIIRFSIDPGRELESIDWPQISPDGKHLAFKGRDTSGQEGIWIRSLESTQSNLVKGTTGVLRPYWSPDSRFLAFSVGRNQLKKVLINGSPPQLIGEIERTADGSWGSAGTIIFDGNSTDSIRGVSSGGGKEFAVTRLDSSRLDRYHAWPKFLPDGKHFLFLASADTIVNKGEYTLCVGSVDSDETKSLMSVYSRIDYAEPGYILHAKDKVLLAQAFDVNKLEIVGEPIPIAEDVDQAPGSALALFSVSNQGTLVYMSSGTRASSELVWINRSGTELGKIGTPDRYGDVALSPDNQKLAYALKDPQTETSNIWINDLKRSVASRFTFEESNTFGPVWSVDGSELFYGGGTFPRIFSMRKQVSGTKKSEEFWHDSTISLNIITDVLPDGKRACLTVATTQADISLAELDKEESVTPLVNSEAGEYLGRVSPDGKLLAYLSDESGQPQLYLTKINGEGKWQISTKGLRDFRWNPAGGELFYFSSEWDLFSVPISGQGGIEIGAGTKLFKQRLSRPGEASLAMFDVSRDGQKFIMVIAVEQEERPKVNVILNWHKLLENY